MRAVRILLLLLLMSAASRAQTGLETFHQALEALEWEKAASLARQLPEGGPRELALAEVAMLSRRRELSYPLLDRLVPGNLPAELRAKFYLVRAHQELSTPYALSSEHDRAVERMIREGLRQPGSAHDRAELLMLKLELTPLSSTDLLEEIVTEAAETPGIDESTITLFQARLAGRKGRYKEARSLYRVLSQLYAQQGHLRARLYYAVRALSLETAEAKIAGLRELWPEALASRDPLAVYTVFNALPDHQRAEVLPAALQALDAMTDGYAKLELFDHLINHLGIRSDLASALATRARTLAHKIDERALEAHFLEVLAGMPSTGKKEELQAQAAVLWKEVDPRGLDFLWYHPRKGYDVSKADQASPQTLREGLEAEQRPDKRNEIYREHLFVAMQIKPSAALARESFLGGLQEAGAFPTEDHCHMAMSLLGQATNNLFAERAVSPYQIRLLDATMVKALGETVARQEGLAQAVLDAQVAKLHDRKGDAGTLHVLAGWLYFLGRTAEARELLEMAAARAPDRKYIREDLGALLMELGDSSGWPMREAVLLKYIEEHDPIWSPRDMGWEALRGSDFRQAERWAREALEHPEKSLRPQETLASRVKSDTANGVYQLLAYALAGQGQVLEGLEVLGTGRAQAVQLGLDLSSIRLAQADLLLLLDRRFEAAEALADVEVRPWKTLSAYELDIRRRVAAATADQAAGTALEARIEAFIRQESSLPDDPVFAKYLQAALRGETPPAGQPDLTPATTSLGALLERLEKLRHREPDNAALARLSAADFKALMEQAHHDELFVQPVLLDYSVVVIYLGKQQAGLVETFCDRARLEATMLSVTEALSDPSSNLEAGARDRRYLAERLVEPWRSRFPNVRRLRWLGEGAFQRLPLSALPAKLGHTLLDEMELTYLDGPSLSSLRLDASSPALLVGGASDLDGAARELRTVRKLFPAGSAWNLDADLTTLKSLLPRHRILHVSTHGSTANAGRLSGQLSGDGQGLSAFQFAELSFADGSLAVLGACQSGVDAGTGRDNTSLVSAARTAGAAVVVGSLWPLDDQVTAELFEVFYRQLRQGDAPEHALVQAQRSVRSHWPHPYYWAGLQLVSGPRAYPASAR